VKAAGPAEYFRLPAMNMRGNACTRTPTTGSPASSTIVPEMELLRHMRTTTSVRFCPGSMGRLCPLPPGRR
jgi:hypothetical protein